MESLAALSEAASHEREPRVQLLLADDDAMLRSLVAARARSTVPALAVLEAKDGAEAIQLGLQRRPQIALIDVNMPRVGGIEVAITLRELQPHLCLALQTGEPAAHRARARECRLPLFDKLELDRALGWIELQAQSFAEANVPTGGRHQGSLACSAYGYGISRSTAPDRCPMCQGERAWRPWRPFRRGIESAI
jgi:CheY-like chemotaxis protein